MAFKINLAVGIALLWAGGAALAQQADPAPVAAAADTPAAPKSFILRGFRLSGAKGVDQDALVDSLKQKPGDRMTDADIDADTAILGAALKAHHLEGKLFATLAARPDGRAWVLWDFQPAPPPVVRHFIGQTFTGNTKLSDAALAAAIGLKPGDELPIERLKAAQQAIIDAYAKAVPGTTLQFKVKVRSTATGQVMVNWTIIESK